MTVTVNDLFNPFKADETRVSQGASALLLAVLIASLMVLMVVANFYASLAEVRGRVRTVLPFLENERAAWNWFGGAPGASTGFMSETSDTLLSNAGGKRQGQSVVISNTSGRERLVPAPRGYPSPTSSVPRQWEFSSSPCDLPAANAGNGNSANVGNRSGCTERLSAVWNHGNGNNRERLVTAGGSKVTGGYTGRNAMKGRERMKDETDLMDILHGQ